MTEFKRNTDTNFSRSFLLGPAALKKANELKKQKDASIFFHASFKDGTTLDFWEFLGKYYSVLIDPKAGMTTFEEVTSDYVYNMTTMLRGTEVLFGGF